MTAYAILKLLHVGTVIGSLSLFLLRAGWMLAGSERRAPHWSFIVPHVVDTGLLASAIAMLVLAGWSPHDQSWLIAKILALLCYIVLGSIALKRGRTRAIRTTALVAALATFGYIVAVALTKSALGPLAALATG